MNRIEKAMLCAGLTLTEDQLITLDVSINSPMWALKEVSANPNRLVGWIQLNLPCPRATAIQIVDVLVNNNLLN